MNNDSICLNITQETGEKHNDSSGNGQGRVPARVCRGDGPRVPRSSLAPLQLARARTAQEMSELAMQVWRQRGLALIDPLMVMDDFARQALINEANRLYGRRSPVGKAVQP